MVDIRAVKNIVIEAAKIFSSKDAVNKITQKGNSDYVTEVDFLVQQYIENQLAQLYPEIQFISEEADNAEVCRANYVWVLDPVDGTTNLIHDYKRSAISLALMKDGETVMGIIYNPYTEELFYAEKGKGSFLNDKPIRVSSVDTMEQSLIAFGTSPYYKELADDIFRLTKRIFMECIDVRRTASAALDLADVACGRIEAYYEPRLKLWDYAAGMLLVREAGGNVLYFDGTDASDDMVADIIAGNKNISAKIIERYM